MFISVQDLQRHHNQLSFEEDLQPGRLDFGPDIRQAGRLKASGQASLIEEHRGRKEIVQDIRLAGNLETNLEIGCARCLEPVKEAISRTFDLLFRPQGVDAGAEEVSVAPSESDVGYYVGDGLELEHVLREQVLLAVPIKTVCQEDCKGLCPHCGQNLNVAECDCGTAVADPRWTALKDLRDKLGK